MVFQSWETSCVEFQIVLSSTYMMCEARSRWVVVVVVLTLESVCVSIQARTCGDARHLRSLTHQVGDPSVTPVRLRHLLALALMVGRQQFAKLV